MTTNTQIKPRRGAPWTLLVWGGAAALLALPLVAMRFTDEVAWTGGDFAIMGAILFLCCAGFELAVRAQGGLAYRAASGLAILTALLIVWLTLAVGIIGDDDPVNLLFGVVLIIAAAGGASMRFRPRGMAQIMVVTAVAQAGMIAAAVWRASVEGVALSAVFTAAWLACAWLYRKSADQGR